MTDINELRKEIDKINSNILDLLLKRQNVSFEIAKYKLKNNLPIIDKNREKIILDNIISKAVKIGLNSDIVKVIFIKIMELSKDFQEKIYLTKTNN